MKGNLYILCRASNFTSTLPLTPYTSSQLFPVRIFLASVPVPNSLTDHC